MNPSASLISLADTNWGHMSNWGAGGWLAMIAFWVLIAFFVAWMVRMSSSSQPEGGPSATQMLERRLASGEISVDEYRERTAALEGLRSPTP